MQETWASQSNYQVEIPLAKTEARVDADSQWPLDTAGPQPPSREQKTRTTIAGRRGCLHRKHDTPAKLLQ